MKCETNIKSEMKITSLFFSGNSSEMNAFLHYDFWKPLQIYVQVVSSGIVNFRRGKGYTISFGGLEIQKWYICLPCKFYSGERVDWGARPVVGFHQ